MKNILKIVFIITFFSCKNEKVIEKSEKLVTVKNIEFVGIEHNKMLDEIFNYLKKQNYVKNRNSITHVKALENFMINKIKSNIKYSKESNDVAVKYTKNLFNQFQYRNKLSNNNHLELSKIEKYYIKKLNQILSVDLKNPSVITKIKELERVIEKDVQLDNKKLITLLSATSTAKYSYKYWSENSNKWIRLSSKRYKKKPQVNSKTDPGSDIVKADVGGAIGGASGAFAVNIIPGAGQVGYGGAIVGGAVAGSVGTAVVKFLDWVF